MISSLRNVYKVWTVIFCPHESPVLNYFNHWQWRHAYCQISLCEVERPRIVTSYITDDPANHEHGNHDGRNENVVGTFTVEFIFYLYQNDGDIFIKTGVFREFSQNFHIPGVKRMSPDLIGLT